MRIILALLPFCLIAHDLEVRLATRSEKKPIYLSALHTSAKESDWRYFEELRGVLEFDLNHNGWSTVTALKESYEEQLNWADVRSNFDLKFWKKELILYVLAAQVLYNRFQLIAFDIESGASKKYADFSLTGRIEEDRRSIHHLADTLQKDLFGTFGVASLQVLYSQRQKTDDGWNSEIWISDYDGANARPVLSEKGYRLSPGFFPQKISNQPSSPPDLPFYYVSFQEGQSKIYRSSLRQLTEQPMIALRGSQALPAISQKGNQMAFITDVAGRPDLFIQNLDQTGKMTGKARQLYSAPRATQASPTFSPDGRQIAFVSDKDGPPRIYLLDVTGPKETKRAAPHLLTKKNRENTSPAWSPDGTKLAYSAKIDGVRQIWIYDFSTTEETQITTGPANKENPAWAPDSLHLIYNTESDDLCELYLTHLNQGEPTLLSKGRFACWEPR